MTKNSNAVMEEVQTNRDGLGNSFQLSFTSISESISGKRLAIHIHLFLHIRSIN